MKKWIHFLSILSIFSFSFICSSEEASAARNSEPAWSEFVKNNYPQWSQHYWVDRELWGNQGYIIGGPTVLKGRRRGISLLAMEEDLQFRMPPAAGKVQTYVVKKGDCLWYIASKPEYYADPFKWPLIFKANQDQIQDPDLIYPGQVFVIPNE